MLCRWLRGVQLALSPAAVLLERQPARPASLSKDVKQEACIVCVGKLLRPLGHLLTKALSWIHAAEPHGMNTAEIPEASS